MSITKTRDIDGVIYVKNGIPHNEGAPAIELDCGDIMYCTNGYLDNKHGPAMMHANGDESWFRNGELHNDYGPALIKGNIVEWYEDGELLQSVTISNMFMDEDDHACDKYGEWIIKAIKFYNYHLNSTAYCQHRSDMQH